MTACARKKVLLMILDGWGIGNHSHADVIYNTPTPYWDYLLKTYPHSQLQASGENVGLPDGQRIMMQDVIWTLCRRIRHS